MAIKLTQADIDFIFAQLTLPGNDPRNGPLGQIIDPTGIRDVQGIGNNVLNPTWGSADQPFLRLTNDLSPSTAQGTVSFTEGLPPTFNYTPTSYATRGVNLIDSSPRTISNLVSNQDGGTFFQQAPLSEDRVMDNPATTPGGRISPLTGNVNPLPYSSYMTLFGQFFDHGLDFVHKGADGIVLVPLLPGDPLYRAGATNNFMVADRTNTIAVKVGVGTTDVLRDALGITETTTFGPVQSANLSAGLTAGGTLVLNNVMIDIPASIAEPASLADIVTAINASTQYTNVIASVSADNRLVLTPRSADSINTISPFIDLSQAYGSAPSHTVFLREYQLDANNGNRPYTTGALVSEVDGSMPTWATIKANAAKIGITLHDYNVTDVPLVRLNADGSTYFDPLTGLASVVAQNTITGEVVFVQDTSKAALAAQNLVLVGIGHAFLDDMAHGVLPADGLTSAGDVADSAKATLLSKHIIAGDGRANENIGLTAIHEVFHAEHNKVLADIKTMVNGGTDSHGVTHVARADAATWTNEMYFQAAKLVTEMEYQHLVFGEFARKFSPNINAFAAYDVTIDPAITAEFAHAVYRFGHSMLTETVGLQRYDANGIAIADTVISNSGGSTITLTTEQNKNTVFVNLGGPHDLVVGNYITIEGIVGSVDGISAADLNGNFKILAVNGNSVQIAVATDASVGLNAAPISASTTITLNHDLGLIEAFLNPTAYSYQVAGEVAIGMSTQVGYGIDEWITGALRNNLVGLPLDLATLNIVRGRDSGIPTLNEVRTQLYNQTQLIDLKPYETWDEFGLHLLHADSLKNFIAAYARDHILTTFGDIDNNQGNGIQSADLATWNALQRSNPNAYAQALSNAADAALSSEAFMLGSQNLNDIDLWLGGLAEAKVPGGMLGSTFDFVFALQMIHLQNADRFYYLNRLAGTDLLAEIEAQLFSDVVMRNTGVKHLYSDIFSVADSYVEIANNPHNYGTLTNLKLSGTAGFVGGTFYGNPGDYLDARGFSNPNGTGNASEMLGGTDNAERINALGGNDTVWGDGGNDTIEGGAGNDFLHGGEGNDTITDVSGGDFIWGDAGHDTINAGGDIDNVFGGAGNDTIRGGLGGDIIDGAEGNDLIYGDNGAITTQLFSGISVEVMDSTGDADIITGGVGNDTIYGGGGTDALDGGEGDDVLYGGLGIDSLVGFHGNDIFIQDASDVGFGELFDGGLGLDTVDYSRSMGNGVGVGATKQGVNINLSDPALVIPAAQVGVQLVPPAPPDAFTSVEKALGTNFNDTISGGTNLTLPNGVILDEFAIPVNFGTVLLPVFVPVNYHIDGGAGQDLIEGGYTFLNLQTAGLANQVATWIADGLYFGHLTVAGSDTLVGGAGVDTISYANAMSTFAGAIAGGTAVAGVTGINLDLRLQGTAQNTINAGLDTLTGFENVIGSAFSDNIIGDANDNQIDGGAGNDVLNGGAGSDTVSYASSGPGLTATAGISLALNANGTQQTVATGTSAGTDIISNFENIIGTAYNDTLSGNNLSNLIEGGLGVDTLSGDGANNATTGGSDTVSYRNALAAVVVTLGNTGNGTGTTAATATRAQEADTLTAFENIIGSSFNDRLTTGNGVNTIEGGDGNDAINGGAGNDTVSYAGATSAVTVNLAITRAQNTLGAGTDTITNMENIIGSVHNDTLTGNSQANLITAGLGNDTINGGGGLDTLVGGQGDDTYIVNNAGVVVTELAGEGVDTIRTNLATISLAGFANVENVTYTGAASVSITGNTGNNVLIAGAGNNDGLIAGGGTDYLDGGLGTGDTATLVGAYADYIWTQNIDGTMTATSALNSSQVTLKNIEWVLFTGSPGQIFGIADIGVDATPPAAVLTTASLNSTATATGHGTEAGTLYLVNTAITVNNLSSITLAPENQWNMVSGTAANTPSNIPLTGLVDGTYKLYAVDATGNLSAASTNSVIIDSVAPTASVTATTINSAGSASVVSNEAGTAYLVNSGITVNNLASITGAANNQWNQVAVTGSGSTALSAAGLADGTYRVYTVDAAGNLSTVAGDTVTVDSTAPNATVATATINNSGNASVQSNETGTAYLVRNTVAVSNVASITGALDNQWNQVGITAVDTNTNLAATGLVDGTYRVYTVDAAGNLSTVAGNTVTIDSTAPTVSSVGLTAATDNVGVNLNAGDKVRASVVFSENVTVTGTPTLGLTIGSTPVTANYLSGSSGANTLVFEYTILAGQNDANGIAIIANSLALNGGTILDSASNSAVLSHALVGDNGNYLVDTSAPTATVSTATINTSGNAVVQSTEVGTAYLVNSGITVNNVASITGALDNQWNQVGITAFDTNTNLAATGLIDGTYRVYTVDAAGNLSARSDGLITIDTAPTVSSVGLTAATDNVGVNLNAGDKVRASVVFSENVTVTGTPTLGLTIGSTPVTANYLSGSSGANTLVFEYTILAGQNDANGIAIIANSLALNGGTILDSASNSAVLSHALVGDNGNYLVDTSAPTATVSTATINTSGNAVVQSTEVGTAYLVNSGITVNNVASITGALDNQWNQVGITAFDTNTNLAATGLIDGTYRVYTVDAAGNLSTVAGNTVTIDSTAPTASVTATTINSAGSASVVSNEAGTAYLVNSGITVNNLASITGAANNQWNQVAVTGSGSTALSAAGLADGTYRVYTVDAAGNLSTVAGDTVTVDSTAPNATVATATINNSGNASVQSNETGTAYLVRNTVAVSNVASITGALDNQWNQVGITAVDTNTNLAATGLVDGTYRVYTVDAAGNLSTVAGNTVTIDSTAPTATLATATTSPGGVVNVQSNELGTAYLVKDTVNVQNRDSIILAADDVWNSVNITAINTNTSLSTQGLLNGGYKLYSVDAAGNLSTVSSGTITIDPNFDNIAPTATLLGATIVANATVSTVATPLTGSAVVRSTEAGTAYLVALGQNPTTVSAITALADGLWNQVAVAADTPTYLSASGLSNGTYRLFTADAVGNLSAASTVTVIVDNTYAGAVTRNGSARADNIGEAVIASDWINALAGADTINSGARNDIVQGGLGNDIINGGAGTDILWGQDGTDTFVFTNYLDSIAGSPDRIMDFTAAEIINLSAVDANSNLVLDQAFSAPTNSATFSGTPGQLIYSVVGSDTLIQADINGDGFAEMQIQLVGYTGGLTSANFVL